MSEHSQLEFYASAVSLWQNSPGQSHLFQEAFLDFCTLRMDKNSLPFDLVNILLISLTSL